MASLNFNVGVLGHIDSGKTSLAKALSTVASTASFDKNPQSKERGITLDLGFSSFCVDAPEHIRDGNVDLLQFTLVDCPGHASLIRTIIGGAQIIDLMLLVVDITKGVQTQTAECLVIGQILCNKMVVVLNKTDLLPKDKQQATVDKMKRRLSKTLENTKFAGCPMVPVAAKPGGPEAPDTGAVGIEELIETLKANSYRPQRDPGGPFIYAVDHCFSVKGQGTVMTGTVLSGRVQLNDTVEIPSMKVSKKVKSMQMFKKPVDCAIQGDRVGVCVTQFDPKQLERGLVCTPGALPTIVAGIISVRKIPYFKGTVSSKAKFHITMGHETVMGRVSFFGLCKDSSGQDEPSPSIETGLMNLQLNQGGHFDFSLQYQHQEALLSTDDSPGSEGATQMPKAQFALLELEKPITCAYHSHLIGSRFDTDIHSNVCRLAFHGKLLEAIADPKYPLTVLPKLKVYKMKQRQGTVERKADEYSVICRGLFKKESNIEVFTGLKVTLSTGEPGVIEGAFGQSGKFKVRIPGGLSEEASTILVGRGKKGKSKNAAGSEQMATPTNEGQSIHVTLTFKRYVHDPKKQMIQT